MATEKKEEPEVFELPDVVASQLLQVVLGQPVGRGLLAAWASGKGIDLTTTKVNLKADFSVEIGPNAED